MTASPATPGQLYDFLVAQLGIGGFEPGREPFYRYRTRQVAQLKQLLAKHSTSSAELVETVQWMKTHGKWATTLSQVFGFVPLMRRQRPRLASDGGFEQAYQAAVGLERDRPNSVFYGRLIRARGPQRREVYAEWLQTQQPSP